MVLFFVFFYPGLHHRGSYVTLTTFPSKATVKVDGVYAGSTPTTIFVKKGTRAIEISKPFYSPVTVTENVLLADVFRPTAPRSVSGIMN